MFFRVKIVINLNRPGCISNSLSPLVATSRGFPILAPLIETMLTARGIVKSYGSLEVIKGLDLTVARGEIISIVGESGAGKSTLLHILGTLDRADQGSLVIDDIAVESLSSRQLSKFRNEKIGFVFQFHHLLPEFTALENVCIPGYISGKSRKAVEARAAELLGVLGVAAKAENKPSELSGGEQQRVAIARALINSPAIIMADEPSGNLDSRNSEELHKLFLDLRARLNQTFIIVTHNPLLAAIADRQLRMKDGKMVE